MERQPREVFASLNQTELYQLCRRAGINVHPGTQKEYLAGYLSGDVEPPPLSEQDHPVDAWRHAIILFLLDYWDRVYPQLKCPAKNLRHATEPNTRPCFGCTDTQVMTCVTNNNQNERVIRLYLPRRAT